MTRDFGLLIIGIALIAWGSCGCASQLPATHPCSLENPEFLSFLAACRARVELHCADVPDDACQVIAECDRAVEARCK
jgi:hypothetical protein